LGVVAVLGNHDHWEGVDACRAAFDSIKIALIDNGRLFLSRRGLSSEPSRDALCIAGVGDLWDDRVDLPAALKDAPADMPRILLSHNPDVAELGELAFNRVDLMLSGHTHGGQVALPVVGALRVPSRFGQRYAGGLCPGPACPVIVSRGVGMTILPVRFGVPPEIGLITLVANDNR
jgi:predicted MPP superfamily phosphohydrolase